MEGTGKEKAWGNWHNWFICPAAKDRQANRESRGSHGLEKPGILCNILGRLQTDLKTHNTYVFNPSFFQVWINLFRCMALVPMTFWGEMQCTWFILFKDWNWKCFPEALFAFDFCCLDILALILFLRKGSRGWDGVWQKASSRNNKQIDSCQFFSHPLGSSL